MSIPTPDSSLRYMISIIPKTDSTLNTDKDLVAIFGFDLVPVINSSNPTRSIGAKISTLIENSINKHYNVRSGDEIYKINNELMRVAPFHKIRQRLDELSSLEGPTHPISITLERGSLIKSVPDPKPESILKLHNKLYQASLSSSSSSSTSSEPTNKRVLFDSKPEICMYQEGGSDHITVSTAEQGEDHSSVNNSCVSSDLGDDRLVRSIFKSYLKQDGSWKQEEMNETTNSDYSWTIGSQEHSHSLERNTQETASSIKTMTIEHQKLFTTRAQTSSFVPPPQDQPLFQHHQKCPNQIDTWSYSTESSPVGLSMLEECEGKTYFSSPGSEPSSHKQTYPRFTNLSCAEDTKNLQSADIPSMVYKEDHCNKISFEDGSVSTVYMSPLSMHPELSSLVQIRDTLQEDLEGKVSTMRKAIQTLERQIFNQSREARNKISTLESSHILAEKEINRLESICVSSSNEAREIRRQLQAKQNELDRLKDNLELERLTFKAQVEKLGELNSDLRSQVDKLTKQLDIQRNNTANARQLAEIELRQELQDVRSEDKELISELCAELKKATFELQEFVSQNDRLTRKIHDLESKLKNDRNPPPIIYADIVKELTSTHAAASAIAKALVESEHELAICMEARIENEKNIELMKKETTLLKNQKIEFEDRILIISHKLKQSNALVDKLSADLKEKPASNVAIDQLRKEWLSAKIIYENQILDLNAKYSSYVTQEDYVRVKNESDRNASVLAAKGKEIEELLIKVKELEDRLERSYKSTQELAVLTPATDPQPISPCNDFTVPIQHITPSSNVDITTQPVAPSKESFKQNISPTFFKTKTRREIIMAANNMKKIRSPLVSIQDNGRALAIRLATSHGKENITCQ